jgi:3-deoxy-D-manno-octulosonic-acid transferase
MADAATSNTFGLIAYRLATIALAPVVPFALRRRLARGKEDASRLSERLGYANLPRPHGQLVWIHGASMGETMAVLPLIGELLKTPDRMVLVTSGTVTSAQLMAERLPPGAIHQFTPVDTPSATVRFLDHWKPDIGLFVESEIWPNMLSGARKRGVKLALINGRMSARSFKGWRYARKTASKILSFYDLCLAQDDDTAKRLSELGARDVQVSGNLKADAPPLPADERKLEALRHAIGDRPVFLASSTHPGEDETILPAYDLLKAKFPNLLAIIAPRHADRGPEIAMLSGTRAVARRALGVEPAPDTAIYVADTMGELGLFYRVAQFVFMGGSLVPHGGQNPLEPARLQRAVLAGPHTENFVRAYDAILSAQGMGRVHSSSEIAAAAAALLADPARAKVLGEAAARGADTLGGAVEKTRAAIENLLASHAQP